MKTEKTPTAFDWDKAERKGHEEPRSALSSLWREGTYVQDVPEGPQKVPRAMSLQISTCQKCLAQNVQVFYTYAYGWICETCCRSTEPRK